MPNSTYYRGTFFGSQRDERVAPLLPSPAVQRAERLASGFVVLVCGDPAHSEQQSVDEAMEHAHRQRPVTLLVHGASFDPETRKLVGVDGWAERWARQRGVAIERHHPDTALCRRPRPRAGQAMRNKMMAEQGAHICISFPTLDWSAGNLVRNAERFNIPVWRPFGDLPKE